MPGPKSRKLRKDWPFPHQWCREGQDQFRLLFPQEEEAVQRSILAWLHAKRIPAWPQDAGGKDTRKRLYRRGIVAPGGGLSDLPEGWPDVIGILPNGRFLAIEVKRPMHLSPEGTVIGRPGVPTSEQLDLLLLLHNNGALVGVAWSVQDVERLVLPHLSPSNGI